MSASERPSERRSAARTGVVWEALRPVLGEAGDREVLDIGGGTGGFAVGVADRVHGQQGDLLHLLDVVGPESADVVLCHGVLEIVDDPAAALATIARVLRPGGTLSLLVAQRHAAVIARAMAGHFQQARALLDATPGDPGRAGHRYTHGELTALVSDAGLEVVAVHAIRVFADLVPGSLLDLEPGAAQALVELEHAVAERPEYLPLATQLHLLARR